MSTVPTITRPSQPSLSHIRLAEPEDFEETYSLLVSYALNPESALSVERFSVCTAEWPQPRKRKSGAVDVDSASATQQAFDDTAHGILENRARSLGLSEDTTAEMLTTLASKKASLTDPDAASSDESGDVTRSYCRTAAILLLSFCIEIAHLCAGELRDEVFEEYLTKCNYGVVPLTYRAFQNLQTIHIYGGWSWRDDERMYYSVEYFQYLDYFHRLPKFQNIVLDGTGEYQMDQTLFPPKSCPSLKSIQMRHVDVPASVAAVLVRAPQALESFTLSLGGLLSIDGGRPMFELKTFAKALETQKDTLRSIDLDIGNTLSAMASSQWETTGWEEETTGESYGFVDEDDEDDPDNTDDEDLTPREAMKKALGHDLPHDLPDTREYGYTIGSLHDFHRLTHLSINLRALVGPVDSDDPTGKLTKPPSKRLIDALPSSLEYLCFYGYGKGTNDEVDELVDELLEKKSERLPKLLRVDGVDETIEGEGTQYGDDPDEDELWESNYVNEGWTEKVGETDEDEEGEEDSG
ncbi:hypothetical protein C8035_v007051 [Colletotrichum spinosum]|uniref:Uncharacterized protein n=1 Tax=Colletotrichum spinosum TaxID=1347390 RepID=A0A4R8QLR0_9PEZI|nr:hypothetical protein C8035_v007051 [Colletotrichum spinosum]